MLKSLYPDIPWQEIKLVGFDLDGTLYDEFEFICQVYLVLNKWLEENCAVNAYQYMLRRWLEKGSSYPYIFREVVESFCEDQRETKKEEIVKEFLHIYRNFRPTITLPQRTKFVLDICKEQYGLFLVTDGNSILQRNKIAALEIGKWFNDNNIQITGDLGSQSYKPSIDSIEQIEELKLVDSKQVVFFGDRECDRQFALNCGFYFQKVSCMQGVKKGGAA